MITYTFDMKIIFKLIGIAAALLLNCQAAFSWGPKGHDVVCEIAQRHLSPKAKKAVADLFEGKSLVYWANWMDNASYTREFAYTKTWHYKNVDAGQKYEDVAPFATGDVVTAVKSQTEALKSGKLNKEAQAIALRMVIHFVGDMHNPMHMGHKSDLGGNKWQVSYFKNGSNLHKLWDVQLVDNCHSWSRTEWADELDRCSKKEIAAIVAGSVDDWAKESCLIATKIYDTTPVGSKIYYDYLAQWAPTVEQQLLRGGLRLAAILNDIFK